MGASGSPAAIAASPKPDLAALEAIIRASSPAPLTLIRSDDEKEDPDEQGACIHSVGSARMCNDISRGWCITGGFAKASFYPGETCASLKKQGLYAQAADLDPPST